MYSRLWEQEHESQDSLDNSGPLLQRNMILFSLFRQLPICLRELIYHSGSWWNSDKSAEGFKVVLDNYAPLDYLPELTDFAETENGSYICMVNELTHENGFFQAPHYVPLKNITNKGTSKYKDVADYPTNMAAFKRIAEWLQYLKDNNLYDNTRIVIVSDHSASDYEACMEPAPELDAAIAGYKYRGRGHYHPLLLFKDFAAEGTLTSDDTFMTNADTASLLLAGLTEQPINPFTQKAIPLDTTNLKADGVIISTCDLHQPAHNGKYQFSTRPRDWWKL